MMNTMFQPNGMPTGYDQIDPRKRALARALQSPQQTYNIQRLPQVQDALALQRSAQWNGALNGGLQRIR